MSEVHRSTCDKLLFPLADLYLPNSQPGHRDVLQCGAGCRGLCSALTLLGREHPPRAPCSPMAPRNPVPNTTSPCPPPSQHLPAPFQSPAAALAPWPPTGLMPDRGIGTSCAQSSNMEIAE